METVGGGETQHAEEQDELEGQQLAIGRGQQPRQAVEAHDKPAIDEAGRDQQSHEPRTDAREAMQRRMKAAPSLGRLPPVSDEQDQKDDQRPDPHAGSQGVDDVAGGVREAGRAKRERSPNSYQSL